MYERRLARWQGRMANRLLVSQTLPERYRASGSHPCDKHLVRRIMMTAAAVGLTSAESDNRPVDIRVGRLRANRSRRSGLHDRILELLHGHPSYHFSQHDLICLVGLESPCIDAATIAAHLEDIVRWRLVQRIEVDTDNVFFDINTTPHLHVYDARFRRLLDAPSSGFVIVKN